MARPDGRAPEEMRPVEIVRGFTKFAPGSVLISVGDTRVLCTATIEEAVPRFLQGEEESARGWVTAEYSMLPGSTAERTRRERSGAGGRTREIERLIGRALRAVTDLEAVGERTIWIDCDVLQADGGTRCAAITGGFVALWDALHHLREAGELGEVFPVKDFVAAVSVGIVGGVPVLDLPYAEDSTAEVDMNLVMTGEGKFVEVQGTAESTPFGREELQTLLDLGAKGIAHLIALQKKLILDGLDAISSRDLEPA